MADPFVLRMYREDLGAVEALRYMDTNQQAVKEFIAMRGGRRRVDSEHDGIPFLDQRGRMCVAEPGDYVVATDSLIWVEAAHRFAEEWTKGFVEIAEEDAIHRRIDELLADDELDGDY